MGVGEGLPGGGWTCGTCSAWVPNGTIHSCGISSVPSSATWPAPVTTLLRAEPAVDPAVLERIAAALERLADSLGK